MLKNLIYESNPIIGLVQEILVLYGTRGYLFSKPRLCLVTMMQEVLGVVEDIKSYPTFPNFCFNIRYQMMLVPSVKLNLQKNDLGVKGIFQNEICSKFPNMSIFSRMLLSTGKHSLRVLAFTIPN